MNKIIRNNIISLGTLQIFNYIIPLTILPYVISIIGPEKYGIIAFYFSFVTYFLIITSYGFNLSATKEISEFRNDIKEVSKIFYNIIYIKFLIGFISIIISFLLVFFIKKLNIDLKVFLFTMLMIIGEIFSPIWIFQGMEKMKYITYINVLIKLLFLLPIFFFISSTEDYIYFPLITSLSYISIALVSFFMAIKIFKLEFNLPNKYAIKKYLFDGWHIFITSIFKTIYISSTTFILGIFTTPVVVGFYATADKIVKAIQGLIAPIIQAIYPSIVNKLNISRKNTILFLKRVLIYISIFTLFLSLILFFYGDLIINLLFGNEFYESIKIVKILSFLPFIVGLSSVMGTLILLNFGYKKTFSKIIMYNSLIFIPISIILTKFYGGVGMAIAVVIIELLINISLIIVIKKNNILQIKE